MPTEVKKINYNGDIADVFFEFKDEFGSVILDSSLKNKYGRFTIIAINPFLEIKEKNGIFNLNTINGYNIIDEYKKKFNSTEEFLEYYLKNNFEDNFYDLPLISGLIGYFSYDYGRKFENIKSLHPDETGIPDALFMAYDNFIIKDFNKNNTYITARGVLKSCKDSIDEIEKVLFKKRKKHLIQKHNKQAEYLSNFKKNDYLNAVQKMINYITEGDIYIANMTQHLKIKSDKNPYEVFNYLRENNPSPFGAYMNYKDFQIISASPERFLELKSNEVRTRPIKGTRKRGKDKDEDNLLREELKNSEKDKSELLMIVDLERNDLNRVCTPGTVKVTELFEIEEYATVFHLVSTIVGNLKEDNNFVDLIKASFPGGSITGAPKIRAMEIIDELENSRRNIYTGSLGYISTDGNIDFNIIIRTLLNKDGIYYLGVGGGVTSESKLEFEYEESLQKAKALLEALGE